MAHPNRPIARRPIFIDGHAIQRYHSERLCRISEHHL